MIAADLLNPTKLLKPELCSAAAFPQQERMPGFVVESTVEEFQIVVNLGGAAESSLGIFVSEDGKRLHLVGEKVFSDLSVEYLWTFALPVNAEYRLITVDRRQDVFLVHIPKRKFWGRAEKMFHRSLIESSRNLPQAVAG